MGSVRSPAGALFALADADDLDGTAGTPSDRYMDVTGAARVVIMSMIGTAGTAGVDQVQVSHDGGDNWEVCSSLVDSAGDAVPTAVLEAAGVEPVTIAASAFTAGPFNGPALLRVCRDTSDTFGSGSSDADFLGTDWVTGAPSVGAIRIG